MRWQSEDGALHENCAVFFKVADEFGGLSNMAGGYPLTVNDETIYSTEGLYQACRFPHQPDWQRQIIDQKSPMAAKMKAKLDGRRANHSRHDWEGIAVVIMRWILRVKLAQHYVRVTDVFRTTGNRAIVEKSGRDRIWGAVPDKDGGLHGRNQLGLLLMELRTLVESKSRDELATVHPPAVPNFLLLGKPIEPVQPTGGPSV